MNTSTIMIIDDDEVSAQMLKESLCDNGYQVVIVNDPTAAMAEAIEHTPDFIIIDIFMPGKSGLEVCKDLRLNPLTCRVPVLMWSSSDDMEHAIASIHLGCVDYIRKPIDMVQFVNTIKKHDVLKNINEVWEPARRELERIIHKMETPL